MRTVKTLNTSLRVNERIGSFCLNVRPIGLTARFDFKYFRFQSNVKFFFIWRNLTFPKIDYETIVSMQMENKKKVERKFSKCHILLYIPRIILILQSFRVGSVGSSLAKFSTKNSIILFYQFTSL